MDTPPVTPGWADKLKPGAAVIVQAAELPARQSLGYRFATVERVTDTEVVVDGARYRRGPGRSELVQYLNEGLDIDRLNDPACGRIWPANAACRRWLERLTNHDYADATVSQAATDVRAATKAAVARGDRAALVAALVALRDDHAQH